MTRIPFGPALSRRSVLRLGAGASAGIALAPLTGCAGPTGAPGPGAISLGLNRSLVSLDNKLNQFDAAVTVQRAVRQALTRIGRGLRPELVLADRFEMTGPTAWTVRLRQGARYSDGTPVTVKDVSTALRMYAGVNGSFIVGLFPEMPTVEPVDERTFRLHTKRPVPILDQLMANILISPAARNRPEELSGGVGSGPYVVTSANSGTGEYTLDVNPRYWGRRPTVDRVRVRFVPEESSRVVAVRSGELDVIDTITPDSAEQLKGLPGVRLDRTSGTRVNQLFFNFRKPRGHPLADARVREALSYAIDGEALVRDVLTGSAQQAEGVIPLALKGSVRTGRYVHDPGKARKRLAALGASDLKVKIIWESGEFPADTSVMEAVLEMLRAVGVRATLQQFEPGGDIQQWRQGRRGDWDVLGNGFSVPTGHASTSLQGMYGGTAEKERTRDTYQGYVFPKIAARLADASAETDEKTRNTKLAAVQQQIWDTRPCLWAFVPDVVLARRTRVRDVRLLQLNSYDLAAVRLEG
ncbi:ABC transporter substrate-binding protein [Streptomyces melanosporofaciens]|uniref:Peptide/nickel transport system substrate-binding protein n=1 Tax=Streptomyces melanosporofaciens TaxID=67327 RepID=A0A1H4XFL1_STRMJ|nr:ABC transporter substrate-binding protein [Streptomyces melanosporofaciens]SED04305.1 peptide/nickel transport system substrate-binding protein [Streptomyces melanosporofaciens]